MALSTILVSGYGLPDLNLDLRLNKNHDNYIAVSEKDLGLSDLPKPQVDDGEGNPETVDGRYRIPVSPVCVPMNKEQVAVPVTFCPIDPCYSPLEGLLKIKVTWLAKYPFASNVPLPIPEEINEISGLAITLTGQDDWGYIGTSCTITAEQIEAANAGLADVLEQAETEITYQDEPVEGVWTIEDVKYDGSTSKAIANIVFIPNDEKTFRKTIVPKDLTITDSRDVKPELLKGLLSFINFEDGAKDSVTGNDWTLGKSTSITDNGKVGKALVTAKNGMVSSTKDDGNNYGESAENVGLYNGTIACWFNENQIDIGGGGSYFLRVDLGFKRVGIYIYVFGNATSTYNFGASINRAYNVYEYTSELNLSSLGITNSEYVHLAITWTEDRVVKMFVNGEYKQTWNVTEQKWNEMMAQDTDAFGIDHGSENNGGGQGLVDEVGFWNRALADSEIKSLYNAGINGITYPFSGV